MDLGDNDMSMQFINCSKYITLAWYDDNGDIYEYEDRGLGETSVFSAKCCCKPKTALKIKSIKKQT